MLNVRAKESMSHCGRCFADSVLMYLNFFGVQSDVADICAVADFVSLCVKFHYLSDALRLWLDVICIPELMYIK